MPATKVEVKPAEGEVAAVALTEETQEEIAPQE
jgi:hypothetical protein